MKTLKFTAFLFYRYYSKHEFAKDMPYLVTITALVLLLFINVCLVFTILNVTFLIPTDGSQFKINNWFRMGFFLLPMYLLFIILIKKEDLINARYGEEKIRKGYRLLTAYLVLSFAFLIILALIKKR